MLNLENIYSLTDFKRNAKEFLDKLKKTRSPLILTVNGKAEVIVQEASAFQEMLDRLQKAEAEVRQFKLEVLQKDLQIAAEQLQNGQYTEYDDTTLPTLLEKIKTRGRQQLDRDSLQ